MQNRQLEPAADEGRRADRPVRATLTGLLMIGVLVGTTNGLSRVALPLFATSLGAQPWQVGLVGGLGYTGLLLLALPMGLWMERHGSRALFGFGVAAAALLFSLALPAVGAWGGVGLLVAVAAVQGLVLPFRVVPVHAEFLHLMPRLAPAQAGWNRAASMLGMFFTGPTLAALLIGAAGYPWAFRVAGALLLLAWLTGRHALEPAHPAAAAQPGGLGALWSRTRHSAAVLREDADLRRTMAIDFLTQMAVGYFAVFVLVLAMRRFNLPVQAAAGLVTLQGAVFVLMLLAGGHWLSRWPQAWTYLGACVCLLLQAVLLGWAWAPWVLWPGAALLGMGLAVQGITSVNRMAAAIQRHGRGRVGGLISLGPPAGGVLGTLVGGLLSQRWGAQSGFQVLAVGFAVLCWAQWRHAVACSAAT